jgi:murein DD-endopeptidase MepM/ murein hydrolase activator NlpD
LAALAALLVGFGSSSAVARAPATSADDGGQSGQYRPPIVPLIVLHGFDPPAHRYGAGTLGVDLAAGAGARVVAAGRGTVVFAGPVAGRGVVVIAHPDGIRTEYEPLRPLVVVGQTVAGGTTIGRISGHHVGCTARCLHWGARRGETYIDPLSLLHPLGPVRLIPGPD